MTSVTIPKSLARTGDLVVIPREEYNLFLSWKKRVKTFKPTTAEKQALARARKEFSEGRYATLAELTNEMGNRRR
jgi:hypothetical protein